MHLRVIGSLLVACAIFAGCSREDAVRCESDLRYSGARSAPPVQIPDDLSPPNENDALRLPADVAVTTAAVTNGCRESPPSFFRDEMPFQRRSDDQQADAPAPPPSDPPPAGGDRVIDN
jgi:uncharacterized lipoprotein